MPISGASSPLHFEVKETHPPRSEARASSAARRRPGSEHAHKRPPRRRRALMTSLSCAVRELGARADARFPRWPTIAPPRGPGTRQHEGDTTFQLRAPLPPPRHRGEEGKRLWGTSGCAGARVARPPAAFRLGRTDSALAGPGGHGRCVLSPPGFIWLQRVHFKARVTPTSCQCPGTSFPLSSGGA